jgi:hypothetical protein
VTEESFAEVERLTFIGRCLNSIQVAHILPDKSDFPRTSCRKVELVRHRPLGLCFLPISSSVPLTDLEIASRGTEPTTDIYVGRRRILR